jgi:hypothetical protein
VGVNCRLGPRTYGRWHPLVWIDGGQPLIRGGAMALAQMYGPTGLVGPVGSTDHPYAGMDPSDPVTWVRPYRPVPGMVDLLNFDGARPQDAQTISSGRKRWGWRK